MPLLEVLRVMNAASLYWNDEPMEVGVFLFCLDMEE